MGGHRKVHPLVVTAKLVDSEFLHETAQRAKEDELLMISFYGNLSFIRCHTEIQSLCRIESHSFPVDIISPEFIRPIFIRIPIIANPPDNIQVAVVIFTIVVVSHEDI